MEAPRYYGDVGRDESSEMLRIAVHSREGIAMEGWYPRYGLTLKESCDNP
jgi:hypothetical protein